MELNKIAFDSNFSLILGAYNQKRIYGFAYDNSENQILKKHLFYEVEVDFLTDQYGNQCIFEINRKQIYYQNKIPGSKLEQIAEKAAQSIFPIKIKINKAGEIDQILNHEAVKIRWHEIKSEIQEYYKGERVLKIITKIENLLLNDILLKESLGKNWFFHLFFKPLYVSYTEKLKFKCIWHSPVFGDQCIEYGVVHTIYENYDADDKIIINADGIAIDERSIDEIRAGYKFPPSQFSEAASEPVESQMKLDYKLYAEDRSIFSVTGSFETKIDENTQQKIQLEIYHLTESSSFRPLSDTVERENQRIYESWQKADRGKGYLYDLSKELRENTPTPEPFREKKPPGERIELFVEEIFPKKKISLWSKIKSIFKKK